jgi:hypothetical protein
MPPDVPPHWQVSLMVESTDAAVGKNKAGGCLIFGPVDIPIARMAVVFDPQRAKSRCSSRTTPSRASSGRSSSKASLTTISADLYGRAKNSTVRSRDRPVPFQRLNFVAPVAQGIERRFPKPCVAGSNPAGGATVSAGQHAISLRG